MPGFDKTGPTGAGPGTGLKQGRCFGFGTRGTGTKSGGSLRSRLGSGLCRRRGSSGAGLGRGRRGNFSAGQERDVLLENKSWLEEKLRAIEDRLSSLRS